MKVLIIEDEKLLADSLKVLLEKKGFTVECVYDGETGEEYAETGVYDLLILDVVTFEDVVYKFGRNHVETVIKGGKVVARDGRILQQEQE